jgi:hypothetical protein
MFISLKEKETVRAAYRTPMHKKTMAALSRLAGRFLAAAGEQSAFQRSRFPEFSMQKLLMARGGSLSLPTIGRKSLSTSSSLARCGYAAAAWRTRF